MKTIYEIFKFPFRVIRNYKANKLGKKRLRNFQMERLILPLEKIEKVPFLNYSDHYKINPTFIDEKQGYIRVTSHSFLGKEGIAGNLLGRHVDRAPLKNGIYYYSLDDAKCALEPILPYTVTPNFEDPRYFSNDEERYLSLTAVYAASKEEGWSFYPAIYNLKSKKLFIFEEERFKNQKNWIIREIKDHQVILTTNFNPPSEVSYNTKTSEVLYSESKSNEELKLNGGSNYITLGEYQVRVLRERVKVNKLGAIHLNYIALYKEGELVQLSNAFNFKEVGMEICNSLFYEKGMVKFAWTFNDLEVFQGEISGEALVEFVERNTRKIELENEIEGKVLV